MSNNKDFVWTDELIQEFAAIYYKGFYHIHDTVVECIQKFKRQKMKKEAFCEYTIAVGDTFKGERITGWRLEGNKVVFNTTNYNPPNTDTPIDIPIPSKVEISRNMPIGNHTGYDKEWEITAFKHGSTETYFNIQPNGRFKCDKYSSEDFDSDSFLHNKLGKTYTIHSVKRLSDGETFSIGDKVGYDNGNIRTEKEWAIDHFFIRESDNAMLARSKACGNVELVDKWLYKNSPQSIPEKTYTERELLEAESKAFYAAWEVTIPSYTVPHLAKKYPTFSDYKNSQQL